MCNQTENEQLSFLPCEIKKKKNTAGVESLMNCLLAQMRSCNFYPSETMLKSLQNALLLFLIQLLHGCHQNTMY